MITWTVLGCASGMPARDRGSSAYLLEVDGRGFLFDTGEGVSQALLRFGKNPNAVERIFLSHFHPDHVMGLPLFIQMVYLLKRTAPLAIYYPEEGKAGLEALFDLTYLLRNRIPFPLEFHTIGANPVFADGQVTVSAHLNTHLCGYAQAIKDGGYPNKMQCYSYLIEAGGRKIVYSADLGSASDLEPLVEGCDLLITESLHVGFQQLFETAAVKGVKKVLLTHMSDEQFSRPEEFATLGQKKGIKEVSIARDGLTIDLSRG